MHFFDLVLIFMVRALPVLLYFTALEYESDVVAKNGDHHRIQRGKLHNGRGSEAAKAIRKSSKINFLKLLKKYLARSDQIWSDLAKLLSVNLEKR